MTTTYEIRLAGNGAVLSGTATELLRAWGQMAYPPHDPKNVDDVKHDLAKRAFVWDGVIVDPTLSDAAFLDALDESSMVAVTIQRGTAAERKEA